MSRPIRNDQEATGLVEEFRLLVDELALEGEVFDSRAERWRQAAERTGLSRRTIEGYYYGAVFVPEPILRLSRLVLTSRERAKLSMQKCKKLPIAGDAKLHQNGRRRNRDA